MLPYSPAQLKVHVDKWCCKILSSSQFCRNQVESKYMQLILTPLKCLSSYIRIDIPVFYFTSDCTEQVSIKFQAPVANMVPWMIVKHVRLASNDVRTVQLFANCMGIPGTYKMTYFIAENRHVYGQDGDQISWNVFGKVTFIT